MIIQGNSAMNTRVLMATALVGLLAASTPATAFRGGFGGFHGGDFGGGFHDDGGFVAHGPDGGTVAGWHDGGAGAVGGTWHADGYHGGGYWGGNHGPVVVNSYYGGGCWGCGAGAAVAAGAVAGAAIGTAAAVSVANSYALGASYATLPTGCGYRFVNGGAYYLCGNAWLAPQYGNNGLHYVVVPAP
jgi:hypothetical protein